MSNTIIIRTAQRKSLCQFSRKIIQPDTLLTLFTEEQYENFKTIIKQNLSQLPEEIVDIIIDKTNYEYYINQWGIVEYVDWIGDAHWQGFQFLGQEDSEDDIEQLL